MHFVYIIYSVNRNKYYIGETQSPSDRVNQHNNRFFSGSSTKIALDWQVVFLIKFDNRNNARKVESYLKSMKSKVFIEKLINNFSFYNEFKNIVLLKFGIKILD